MEPSPDRTDYAHWRDRLATANDPAFWPIEAIDRELHEGRAQFWCDGSGALVTRAVEYPGGAKVLEALAAAGGMKSLVRQICGDVEQKAKDAGFTHLMVAGRPGWARVFKDWRHYQSVMLKDLG